MSMVLYFIAIFCWIWSTFNVLGILFGGKWVGYGFLRFVLMIAYLIAYYNY